jgi:hypothetical protein
LGNVDNENGVVTFETGMSKLSWEGQNMSAHILDIDEETVQITIGGNRKTHGASRQLYDWNEAAKLADGVFAELDGILGAGKRISAQRKGCFIATAVYQDYNHPQLRKLRAFRDTHLESKVSGRALIRLYYWAGPKLALLPSRSMVIRRLLRRFFDLV